MRILIALPGMHQVRRGAEVALGSIASELARAGDDVTVMGMGQPDASRPYRFVHVGGVPRERFVSRWVPTFPPVRGFYEWEDLTFATNLLRAYRPSQYDVTITSNFPFTHWALRRRFPRQRRVPHVFVTQNGDWPAYATDKEYGTFRCDGLVCVNPVYFERNSERWPCALIANGADVERFHPGPGRRAELGLPDDRPIALIVSALVPDKRVLEGIEVVAAIPEERRPFLMVAGAGQLEAEVRAAGTAALGGGFRLASMSPSDMPDLYRSVDVLLHPSLDEPGALTYAEALASGLPIVAHTTPLTEWIVGDLGTLIDMTDVKAAATALADTLEADAGRTEQRAASARERLSWAALARQYRTFLEQVVGDHQR